jgi:hypothetical protein
MGGFRAAAFRLTLHAVAIQTSGETVGNRVIRID